MTNNNNRKNAKRKSVFSKFENYLCICTWNVSEKSHHSHSVRYSRISHKVRKKHTHTRWSVNLLNKQNLNRDEHFSISPQSSLSCPILSERVKNYGNELFHANKCVPFEEFNGSILWCSYIHRVHFLMHEPPHDSIVYDSYPNSHTFIWLRVLAINQLDSCIVYSNSLSA